MELNFKFERKKLIQVLILSFVLSLVLEINLADTNIISSNIFQSIRIRLNCFSFPYFIVPFFIAGFILLSDYFKSKLELNRNLLLYFICLLFGIANTVGLFMYYRDSLPDKTSQWFCFFLMILAWAYVFLKACYIVIYILENHINGTFNWSERKLFLISWGLIFLCWLPWIISYYPASADWDVYYPIQQFLGIEVATNHHPWAYDCIVGAFYKLGLMLGNKNIGFFLYMIIRDLIVSGIYARVVCFVKKAGLNKFIVIGTLLFYAITPVWGAYAKHAFKDTIGVALFTWFILETIKVVQNLLNKDYRFKNYIGFACSELIMSMFRNNFIYVAIPVSFILVIICIRKKKMWKLIVFFLIGVIAFEGYEKVLFNVVGIEPGNVVEALSIPLQQTARTVRDYKDQLTDQEYQLIDEYFGIEDLSDRYDPLVSDHVKDYFNSDLDISIYFSTWFKMFFEYPKVYFEAAFAQSYGYYAFTYDQVDGAGNGNCGMTIFNWTKDDRFDDDFTFDYIGSLDYSRTLLENWAKLWHQLPILNLTDMKALYTWLTIVIGFILIRKKKGIWTIPVIGVLLVIATCCASPVNDCFRYFAPAAASFPLMLTLLTKNANIE